MAAADDIDHRTPQERSPHADSRTDEGRPARSLLPEGGPADGVPVARGAGRGLHGVRRHARRNHSHLPPTDGRGSADAAVGTGLHTLPRAFPLAGRNTEDCQPLPREAIARGRHRAGLAVLGQVRLERHALRRGPLPHPETHDRQPAQHEHATDGERVVEN